MRFSLKVGCDPRVRRSRQLTAARPCFTRDRPETDPVFSKFKELLDLPLAKAGNSSQNKERFSASSCRAVT